MQERKTYGIGLVIIGIVLIASLLSGLVRLIELFSVFNTQDWISSVNDYSEATIRWKQFVFFEIGILIVSIILASFSIYYFFTKKKRFPDMLITTLFIFFSLELLHGYISSSYAKLTAQAYEYNPSDLVKIGVFGLIASMFVKKSPRVKAIFVK